MTDHAHFRQLLTQTRALSRMPIDPADTRDALDAVRQRLALRQRAVSGRYKRILFLSGGIAAAVGVAISLIVATSVLPRHASAAENLQASAQVTQDYRGWVHVTLTPAPATQPALQSLLKMPQPVLKGIHINTADGTTAIVFEVLGQTAVLMVAPPVKKQFEYVGMINLLRIAPMDKQTGESTVKRSAELPLKLADFLAQAKADGMQPEVAESTDGALQRFDLTFKGDPQKFPENYRHLTSGKQTLWVDPQSKLIRKMQTQIDGQLALLEYAYGNPQISDIYDLGVPRTAKIIEEPAAAEGQPPAFKIPSIARLTKDPAIDQSAFLARLQRHRETDFGDFLMLECNQSKAWPRSTHAQGSITLLTHQGDKELSASYSVAPMLALFGGPGFPEGWPQPTLNNTLSLIKSTSPSSLLVRNGKDFWQRDSSGQWQGTVSAEGKVELLPATRPAPYIADFPRLGTRFWGYPPGMAFSMGGKDEAPKPFGTASIELLRDPDRPTLIVLHYDQTIPFRMPGATADFHEETFQWHDPAHDDLPVETLVRSNSVGPELTIHTITLDFGRMKDGRWFPAHGQQKTTRPPQPGIDQSGYSEFWRQLFTDTPLPPEWYTDPAIRLKNVAPLFPPHVDGKTQEK